jgi:hypothetical protein
MSKSAAIFSCEICDFSCSKQSNYDRHLLSSKHKNRTELNEKEPSIYFCKVCDKTYKARNSLWYHEKKCKPININLQEVNKNPINPSTDVEMLTTMFIESIKQNQEFQKQMFDLLKDNIGSTHTNSHNTSNVNSHNNFNLNFFLNETCKDAMNIKEFIESLQVHFQDLEYNGENGYAAGISNIFLRELNKLDVCKRPIHCSDSKREVFHIKNEDGWEKERELLIKCIKQITRKNIILLADWRNAHPGCMDLHNKINDKYNKINCETLGPYLDDEEKKCFNRIISSVAKATIIDKKCVGSATKPP